MNREAKMSGCIVSYNNSDIIKSCIDQIEIAKKDWDFDLYVVDNCSTDGTPDIIEKEYPDVILIRNEANIGFGAGHNVMLPHLDSDYHFVINPDIHMQNGVIEALVDYLNDHGDCAMITPKILNSDGSEQFLPKMAPQIKYVILSKLPFLKKFRKEYTRELENISVPTSVEFCTGCFFCIRSSVFKELNGFDDRFFMYMEDADLSRRVLKYGEIIFDPEVSVFHDWSRENTKSFHGISRWLHSMVLYFNKWGWKF